MERAVYIARGFFVRLTGGGLAYLKDVVGSLGGISGISRSETPVGAMKGKTESDKERSRYLTFFW